MQYLKAGNSGILPPSGLTSSEPGEGSCTERLSRAKEAVSHPQPPGRKGAGGVSPQFHLPQFHLPPAPGSLAPPPLAKTNQSQWVIHSSRRERVLPVRVLCPKGDQHWICMVSRLVLTGWSRPPTMNAEWRLGPYWTLTAICFLTN